MHMFWTVYYYEVIVYVIYTLADIPTLFIELTLNAKLTLLLIIKDSTGH